MNRNIFNRNVTGFRPKSVVVTSISGSRLRVPCKTNRSIICLIFILNDVPTMLHVVKHNNSLTTGVIDTFTAATSWTVDAGAQVRTLVLPLSPRGHLKWDIVWTCNGTFRASIVTLPYPQRFKLTQTSEKNQSTWASYAITEVKSFKLKM